MQRRKNMANNHMLIYAMIICLFPYLVVTFKTAITCDCNEDCLNFFTPLDNLKCIDNVCEVFM
ncbi:putative Late nodulin [Medicago truncatula]|uniref:Late nodulin n=1 Tax=Medicago truncatula TaxID=3880 RepID=A7KHD1_MEDTR|nr:nodule-specific cysteine-rich peptide 278 [Medicago truncatula]AES88625.1 late nodulin [Medicago truncatula]AFK40112.1 unknown [Medicago truncatula]RHN60779.1 putative Late nodulin [Medicago truncatula]